ncbi:MAG: GNAT family N-acetyltransferase [Burkholderiaceae bacterium]
MGIQLVRADYANARHSQALVALLSAYALDPAGGGQPLSDYAKAHVVAGLAQRPQAFSVLAFDTDSSAGFDADSAAVGLVNCFEGFSTFAARPLVNVHDVVVLPSHRGQGVAQQMLLRVEQMARERGACKLTLEVLGSNHRALGLYQRLGFAAYQLDPAMGQAQFLQKWLP